MWGLRGGRAQSVAEGFGEGVASRAEVGGDPARGASLGDLGTKSQEVLGQSGRPRPRASLRDSSWGCRVLRQEETSPPQGVTEKPGERVSEVRRQRGRRPGGVAEGPAGVPGPEVGTAPARGASLRGWRRSPRK